jgi:hypothetical protein
MHCGFNMQICTERHMDCVEDVCEKYETGCASECVMYKTKYYEERMEPIIEEIDVCKEFETFEFTVCGAALNIGVGKRSISRPLCTG